MLKAGFYGLDATMAQPQMLHELPADHCGSPLYVAFARTHGAPLAVARTSAGLASVVDRIPGIAQPYISKVGLRVGVSFHGTCSISEHGHQYGSGSGSGREPRQLQAQSSLQPDSSLFVEAAVKVLPASGTGEDRAIAVPTAGGYLVAVADGAGGTGGGSAAAESLIALLSRLTDGPASTDWFAELCKFDDDLAARRSGGQTTGVVAFVKGDSVIGASVGDSSAWLITPAGETTDLTARQRRRPLLGSGEALPVQFEADLQGGRVLLGSDGLFKYATAERICALAMQGSVTEAADALANCMCLPSGALQDDVAVVLVSGNR
jgi:serine/threonine protein phosphatase PrpC